MRRILVTGALGQIGTELVPALRERYGADRVVASDHRMMPADAIVAEGPFEQVDCTRIEQIQEAVRRYNIGAIYHLAALLSALAEEKPQAAWDLNMGGLYRVLEVARQNRCQVFLPSSIGAFGPTTPPDNTPQDTIQRPITIYKPTCRPRTSWHCTKRWWGKARSEGWEATKRRSDGGGREENHPT